MDRDAMIRKLRTALSAGTSGAEFSDCGNYRYLLWRQLPDPGSTVLFIGLNPSTADASHNDPTIRRMLGFARDWGHGCMLVANVYAWRATRPTDLFSAADPEGPHNRGWLHAARKLADRVVCCWGNHGHEKAGEYSLQQASDDFHCLALNNTGAPAHPLYQPRERQPRSFRWPAQPEQSPHERI